MWMIQFFYKFAVQRRDIEGSFFLLLCVHFECNQGVPVCADFVHLKYRTQGRRHKVALHCYPFFMPGLSWSLVARLDSVEALDLLPPVPRAQS